MIASRTSPLSKWGFERGTPIDRWYIERFLDNHQECIGGRTLEVLEDLYASRLGAANVDVVDIDPSNPAATIRGISVGGERCLRLPSTRS